MKTSRKTAFKVINISGREISKPQFLGVGRSIDIFAKEIRKWMPVIQAGLVELVELKEERNTMEQRTRYNDPGVPFQK